LASGASSSHALVRDALERAAAPGGEGARVFTERYEERALRQSQAWDQLRAAGYAPTPLAGIPISIKDLFDVAGRVTTAGSRVLADREPAAADAEVVKRLRQAGAVIVGRTNMTELAYSGLGLNPHFGTPLNPFGREQRRIPGGSSSGAAVSVTDGMCVAAVGTDTGGSVRIPAALCGLVGFKPTARRVPMQGVVPLSPTLDSVGPIARTVECCALLDAVMAGEPASVPEAVPLAGLRIGVAQSLVWDGADRHVASHVQRALERLSRAGAVVVELALGELKEIPLANAKGGFSAPEAFAWHRALLAHRRAAYDPRVAVRIEAGGAVSAADYLDLIGARARIQGAVARAVATVDCWAMPTVPVVAPRLDALAADEAYFSTNALMLRNPSLVNFLDGGAISLPCHTPGEAPAGISLVGAHGADRRLLAIARSAAPVVAAYG
jgi:aspartyl-tRNA(Asn)/glutamyl-tRNA(Gln) amidotransferase subunit A